MPLSSLAHPQAYQACLRCVSETGSFFMGRLIDAALAQMRSREADSDTRERQALASAAHLLGQHTARLRERFPAQLLEVIGHAVLLERRLPGTSELHFDELELMDDAQVQENVELARMQQAVLLIAEGELVELDARFSTVLGHGTVRSDRNPFRPQAFGQALRTVLQQTHVEPLVRVRWMHYLGGAMGHEVQRLYEQLNQVLRFEGIARAGYTVTQAPPTSGAGTVAASKTAGVPKAGALDTALTMDQLHRLLTGNLEADAPDTDAPPAGFSATVPGALETLQQMRQLDAAVERLRGSPGSPLKLGQRLGREVVHLMVASMAQDASLLEPVRQAIAELEPALLQLALSDPRFLSERAHPARVLLDRITQRSLAFTAPEAPGFAAMMQDVRACVQGLLATQIDDHTPFAAALERLDRVWTERTEARQSSRNQAVQVLIQAEQRNLLAQKLAAEMADRPDATKTPSFVREFLAGPWAQVMAQAQLQRGHGLSDPDGYGALVPDLLWSVKPELILQNRQRLVRVIPPLLVNLREGLQTVQYPQDQAESFFAKLMTVHDVGLRPLEAPALALAPDPLPERFAPSTGASPWLAPAEMRDSGLMGLADTQPATAGMSGAAPLLESPEMDEDGDADSLDLRLGAWIEFMVKGQWVRAQLTWASPHGTLFMFTSAQGEPHSMTRRTLNRMRAYQALRVVTQSDLVVTALDAVARTALRNSADNDL